MTIVGTWSCARGRLSRSCRMARSRGLEDRRLFLRFTDGVAGHLHRLCHARGHQQFPARRWWLRFSDSLRGFSHCRRDRSPRPRRQIRDSRAKGKARLPPPRAALNRRYPIETDTRPLSKNPPVARYPTARRRSHLRRISVGTGWRLGGRERVACTVGTMTGSIVAARR